MSRRTFLGRLTRLAILGTLAFLPSEYSLPRLQAGPITLTALELLWGLTVTAWAATVLVERRTPNIPRALGAAIAAVLAVGLVSSLLADEFTTYSLRFVGRTAAGLLLMVVIVDTARSWRDVRAVVGALVIGGAVAAAIGLVAFVGGDIPLLSWLARDEFVIAGNERLQATFDYPNTAGMAFEACLLLTVGLIGCVASVRWRVVLLASAATLALAMLLTFSRGATLGAAFGFVTVALLALATRRIRVAAVVAGSAAAVIAGTVALQFVLLPVDRLLTEGNDSFYGAASVAPAVIQAAPDEQVQVTVSITNTGTFTWNRSRPTEVVVGYRWLDPRTLALLRDGGQWFQFGETAPGQTSTTTVLLQAPSAPGNYLVGWDVLAEHVGWLSDRGRPIFTSQLQVGAVAGVPVEPPPPTTTLRPELRQEPARFELWRAALTMIGEQPLFGVGPGTFRLRYGTYLGQDVWNENIHANNMYLEIAATTGLIGLAAFLLLVVPPLLRLTRHLVSRGAADPASQRLWLLSAFTLGTLAAFLAHGMVDYFLGFNATAGIFWSVLGLAVVLPRLRTAA